MFFGLAARNLLHRGARVRRERPAEKIVDAFDGAERIALDRLEAHVEKLRGGRAIAHGEERVERARPAVGPICGDTFRLCAVAERAAQHRRMARHRRHDAQRIAMRVDDARVGVAFEQAREREQMARRFEHPAVARALRLQVLQEAMVKVEAELLRRALEPVLIRRDVVRRVELDAHEDLRRDRDALLRQICGDRMNAHELRRQAIGPAEPRGRLRRARARRRPRSAPPRGT